MSNNVTNAHAEAEAFKAIIKSKMDDLVQEFSEGKISREQFQVLYERYNGRLSIANQALVSGNPEAIKIAQSGPSTLLVRDIYMGRALGIVIYHDASGTLIETLGTFDVAPAQVTSTLVEIDGKRRSGSYLATINKQINEGQWLIFVTGKFTTVVVLFKNEPSQYQIKEIERIHYDFEQANQLFLGQDTVDTDELADPFYVFVKRWSQEKEENDAR